MRSHNILGAIRPIRVGITVRSVALSQVGVTYLYAFTLIPKSYLIMGVECATRQEFGTPVDEPEGRMEVP